MQRQMTRFQKMRAECRPALPAALQRLALLYFEKGKPTTCLGDIEEVKKQFPHTFGRPLLEVENHLEPSSRDAAKKKPLRVGVVFSGGQASGGHNVIAGLFDALMECSKQSRLIGFIGGPKGVIQNKTLEISQELLALYRNQGGFDLIGSGRDKIETEEHLTASLEAVKAHRLDGLVIIGGDDSNTNAALLAEFFLSQGASIIVVGVPKTIDGDLQNAFIATSFGFDTACKTYAEMIGNIARDALSSKKYYHFIKLMGRSASHVTLECALSTHPNLAFIGEEVSAQKMTLTDITNQIVEMVIKRAQAGKHYGVILIPEGLIEFVHEMKGLIREINQALGVHGPLSHSELQTHLEPLAKECFLSLPLPIQEQLLLERDPHGNVQVSMIETDKLLISMVEHELKRRKFSGKFSPLSHFFGYEGRSAYPSNFDTHYCYSLGYAAALLIREQHTGYMACIGNLTQEVRDWSVIGIPITMLMHVEVRKGKRKPVIQKALVDLKKGPFCFFKEHRPFWMEEDCYRYPGPMQFFGDGELADSVPLSLQIK